MAQNGQAISLAQTIYQDINEWLKFAEAKHAALLAAWIALWIGIASLEIQEPFIKVRCIALICITICGFFNFLSFLPFLNKSECLKKRCMKKYGGAKDNILFYLSVFIQSAPETTGRNTYKANFMNSLECGDSAPCKLLDNYLDQIIDVSTVATIKVYLFSLSLQSAFLSLGVVLLSLLIA